jgi:hypothetical protein
MSGRVVFVRDEMVGFNNGCSRLEKVEAECLLNRIIVT